MRRAYLVTDDWYMAHERLLHDFDTALLDLRLKLANSVKEQILAQIEFAMPFEYAIDDADWEMLVAQANQSRDQALVRALTRIALGAVDTMLVGHWLERSPQEAFRLLGEEITRDGGRDLHLITLAD